MNAAYTNSMRNIFAVSSLFLALSILPACKIAPSTGSGSNPGDGGPSSPNNGSPSDSPSGTDSGNPGSASDLVSANTSDAKTLFLSTEIAESSARSLFRTTEVISNLVLKKVTATGEVKKIQFFSKGDVLQSDFRVLKMKDYGSGYIGVQVERTTSGNFSFEQNTQNLLLAVESGRLFALKTDIDDIFIKQSKIYVLDRNKSQLMKGELGFEGDIALTPVNNPAYDPINKAYDLYVSNIDINHPNNLPFLIDENETIAATANGSTYTLFLANGEAPVHTGCGKDCLLPIGGEGPIGLIYGSTGRLIQVNTGSYMDYNQPRPMTIFTYAIAREIEFIKNSPFIQSTHPEEDHTHERGSYIYPKTNYTVFDRARYYPYNKGFYFSADDGLGGITMTWHDMTSLTSIPAVNSETPPPTIAGSKIFWKLPATSPQNSKIQFLDFANPTEAVQTFVEDTSILDFKVVGGTVIYTKYMNATQVSTYQVRSAGGLKILISSSDIGVSSIVEVK